MILFSWDLGLGVGQAGPAVRLHRRASGHRTGAQAAGNGAYLTDAALTGAGGRCDRKAKWPNTTRSWIRFWRPGSPRALEDSGFKRRYRRARIFARESEDRFEFVQFVRIDKWDSDRFYDVVGIFSNPLRDLYDELFPDGSEEIEILDTRWRFPCHFVVSIAETCDTTVEYDPDGEHPYTFTQHYLDQVRPDLAAHTYFGRNWEPARDTTSATATDVAAIWNTYTVPWLKSWQDPSFLASWVMRDRREWQLIKPLYAAILYRLAGEEQRTRSMLQECHRRCTISFRDLEHPLRKPRFLGYGTGPSTPETRGIARRRFRFGQKIAAEAVGWRTASATISATPDRDEPWP